ncbi:hypothetical protein [Nocardia rhizosphaerae]|uniref:HTH HARE-type domain-containing protein n=1 Tax=Nocardia rhizosphaerae TaxID=1691571 RepID=A0ABV8L693_9NOCA
MPESKVDAIVEELREYQRWLASETRRVDRALRALSDDDDDESRSTNEMLLDAFLKAKRPLSIQDALAMVRKAGWTTDSKDPANVIRAALARMASNGELRRVSDKRGIYALPSDDPFADEPPDSTFDDAPPWESKVQDDSWGSSSRANPFESGKKSPGTFTRPKTRPREEDEPPF